MTMYQLEVLNWMYEASLNAVRLGGTWIWRDDVRKSPRLAEAVFHMVIM